MSDTLRNVAAPDTATVRINGRDEPLTEPVLAEVLRVHGIGPGARGVAVAINGEVVRRDDWAAVRLAPGDAVEIVRPFAGG